MAVFTTAAALAYEDNDYGWVKGECSQGNGSEWGAGTLRFGILHFPGLGALRGLPIQKVTLSFALRGGYSSGKGLYFYASKRSGINTSLSAKSAYIGKSLGSLTGLANQTYEKDVTMLLGEQIRVGQVSDTFVLYKSNSELNYLKIYNVRIAVTYTAVTPCKAPTSLSVTPGVCENQVTLTWAGAKGGVGNAIYLHEVQCRIGKTSSSLGGWTVLRKQGIWEGNGTLTYDPELPRGYLIQYRVRVEGVEGEAYASPFVTSATVRKNSAPTAPGAVMLSKNVFEEGEQVTLSWNAATDVDGNLVKYEIQQCPSGGTWVPLGTVVGTRHTFAPTGAVAGQSLRYRVRGVDGFSVAGPYRESPSLLREEAGCLWVCVKGAYKKARVFACVGGTYQKVEVLVCKNGRYQKAVQ